MTLSDFINELSRKGFGMTRDEAWESGVCIFCKHVTDRSKLKPTDLLEYDTSALCPECFASICTTADKWGDA